MPPKDDIMREVCFLLRLFHETVSPFAKERCIMSAKTGTHVRSVTETLWFVEDIATYAYEMLQSHQGDTVQRFDFIPLPHARQIVRTPLDDACTGKWSWTPRPDVELLLTQAEREECEKRFSSASFLAVMQILLLLLLLLNPVPPRGCLWA